MPGRRIQPIDPALAVVEAALKFRDDASPTSSSRFALAVLKSMVEHNMTHAYFQGKASAEPWIKVAVSYGLLAWEPCTGGAPPRLVVTEDGEEIYEEFQLQTLGRSGMAGTLAYAWDWSYVNGLLRDVQEENFATEAEIESKAARATMRARENRARRDGDQPKEAPTVKVKKKSGRRQKVTEDAEDMVGFDPGCRWRALRPAPAPYDIVIIGPGTRSGMCHCRLEFKATPAERASNPFVRDLEIEYSREHIRERARLVSTAELKGGSAPAELAGAT